MALHLSERASFVEGEGYIGLCKSSQFCGACALSGDTSLLVRLAGEAFLGLGKQRSRYDKGGCLDIRL